MEALSQLEVVGVTILQDLKNYKQQLQSVIRIIISDLPMELDSLSLLKTWLQGHANLRPSWRHLFWVLREIKLSHLADQIESYLTGVSVERASSPNIDPRPDSEESEERGEEDKEEGETD